ncbi:hypothetical protein [Saccharolobus shibatae]|uniref:Uncharacterized protein n=1 Tax=Saccharolobus shibatae TaxID=2286 RepID=A0A8F5BW87_9CREN|nr:hypothetical protein [Saccharolobus shibatae]QXJ32632.1 hypothetical protein J5U21_02283 [Saccharolobus shibatae]
MNSIIVKGHIISSYYDGIYINYFPDDKKEYLKKIWLEKIKEVFSFSPRSNNDIVITGYSQYFDGKEAYIAYGEDRIIEGRPYVHLHVLVLDIDEYKKANYNIFNTNMKFIQYEIFRKNEINLQWELRVNEEIMNSLDNDVDNILNSWLNGNRIFYLNNPENSIRTLAKRIGGNFTYVINLSPKDQYNFDIIVYKGTNRVTNFQPKQIIMDYIEKVKSTEKIFKFVSIYQFLKSLNIKMKEGKNYQEALLELIEDHCHNIMFSRLYDMLEGEFGKRATEIFNHILSKCLSSHELINDPDFIQVISKIGDYPKSPLHDLIETIKKQERERKWNIIMQTWNGDYKEAYEKLSQIYQSSLEILEKFNELLTKENVNIEKLRNDPLLSQVIELIYNKYRDNDYGKDPLRLLLKYIKVMRQFNDIDFINSKDLEEIIPHLTRDERKKLIGKYLKENEDSAKSYLNLFDKRDISEVINEIIGNKDGLLIIGRYIHDYLDRETKCFSLLIQWIEKNKVEDASEYIGKIKHAFSDLQNTKKGLFRKHVDLSNLEPIENKEEIINKIKKLLDYSGLEEDEKRYILEELENYIKRKKEKSDKRWRKY